MIRGLTIVGFKRFREQHFELAPLTVLTGLNGSGKTSLIHAILLAREASSVSATQSSVRLNGPFGLELGTAEDVRNWDGADAIALTLQDDTGVAHWRFSVPAVDALHLTIVERSEHLPASFSPAPRAFTYLSAERLGPRNVLGSSALPNDALEVGTRGEFCAEVIEAIGGKPLSSSSRRHPLASDVDPSLLKYEAERWLADIARPVELDAAKLGGTTVTTLRYRAPGGDWVRAPNMGFGVTYALPIILAGLIAQPGGLLVVENPEAHLHPAGQSRIGVFLAWLAARGVQVIVETHSDHVLNGLRRAVGEGWPVAAGAPAEQLRPDQALIHYFDTDESGAARVAALRLTATGGVSGWPKGFFDQYQLDIAALTRVRRPR